MGHTVATNDAVVTRRYANGVEEAHDAQSVLVVETNGFRVLQHWVAGPRAGTTSVLIDRLPGFPDGISKSSDGNYWLCLVAPLSPLLRVLGWPRPFRYLLARAMVSPLAKYVVKRWGCVVKVSPAGAVLEVLMDPTGARVATVSAAVEHDGHLFLGNLGGDYVSVYKLDSRISTEKTQKDSVQEGLRKT